MPSKFPKGSEWRRWDLHIHTPASTLHNEFNGWDTYLAALEAADAAICAVGITDYASLDGYKRVRDEIQNNGRLSRFSLVVPNIEFRVSPFTKKGAAINLHILIDPKDSGHIHKIDDALSRLTFKYQGGQKYPCSQVGLTELGKAFNSSIKDDQVAYREGINQFKPDFDAFRDWYEGEKWLRRNSLVVVSNGSNDGASGLNHDDGYRAKRQEIYRFSHAVFSGNPKDREYFCGKGPDGEDQLVKTINGRKPCIHGSDAHKEEQLFKPAEERYCWIKADPTFEGLRQILYEPDARVYLGKSFPEARDENRIISSIRFSGKNRWFRDIELPINPALVSIVGSKGSGKTALVDLVAYATGSWVSNTNSFLHKAHKELEGTEIVVTWAGGQSNSVEIPRRLVDGRDQKVRYLSQQFVEHLCSEDKVGTELVHEIEQVIFEYLDDTEKLGETSFSGLRTAKTGSVRNQQIRLRSAIAKLNQEIDELRSEIEARKLKADRVDELEKERIGLEKQRPAFDSEDEQKTEDELSALREARQKLVEKISARKQQLVSITELRDRVMSFEEDMSKYFEEIAPELRELGIEQGSIENFRPSFRGDVRSPFNDKEKLVLSEIDVDMGAEGDKYPAKTTLSAVEDRINELEKLSSVDQAKKQKNTEIQKRIAAIEVEIGRLKKAIEQIDTTKQTELNAKIEDRWGKYLSYFDILRNEQKILESLYRSLGDALGAGSKEEQSLEFYIRWRADIDAWAGAGDALLDKRKQGPYRPSGELSSKAKELLIEAWSSGAKENIRSSLESMRATFDAPNGEYSLDSQLLSGVNRAKFDDWLFSTEHIALSYGIRYDGIELENLSPGTKGIVLLILYLEMDKNDRRPLLIDQPEENLDNESVYRVLTRYFRKAKPRRQIILITHNPNLVVNTDSEQVIVASYTKAPTLGDVRIKYALGSLEDTRRDPTGVDAGTREKVCEILEGGERAFHMREQKYAFNRN